MRESLVIRADAGSRMGMGHIMRCIALGQAWKDAGGRVIFIGCFDSKTIPARIRDEGFKVEQLPKAFPESNNDLKRTLQAAKEAGAHWLVLDGYHFDLSYQRGIRQAGIKLLCIDDFCLQPAYEADILLNQNISADMFNYESNEDCRKLLGTQFAMLRREFRNAVRQDDKQHIPQKLLVTMGGSDPDNASLKVIKALEKLEAKPFHTRIIVGPSNQHFESLQEAVAQAKGTYELINSVQDMPTLIKWADFAISAAGGTCWELVVMGVPFATVILADNQEELASQLEQKATIFCAGWADEGLPNRISGYMASVLKDDKISCRIVAGMCGLVDRFGVDRVLNRPAVDSGLDLYANRLVLRRVSPDDAGLLFEWANDFSTRANSFNADPIPWEDHVSWLNNKLKADETALYMLEIDGVPCGHIRYDLEKDGSALLNFVVAPTFRAIGLGFKLVDMSIAEPFSLWGASSVKAVTFAENISSARVFERLGFILEAVEQIEGRQCNVYRMSGE